MHYEEHPPEPSLSRHILCYWFLTGCGAPGQIQPVVPDGRMELIVNLADRFLRHRPGGQVEVQAPVVVAGQIVRPIVIEPGARVDLVGVRFQPAGAVDLLGVPSPELREHILDAALVDAKLTRDLADRLHAAADVAARVRILDDFFSRRRGAAGEPDALVSTAVRHIERDRGRMPIGDLAAELGVHARTLERRFGLVVGLAPKVFARIVRFRSASRQLRSAAPGEWSRIALRSGYYDQAHLIREFHAFAGASPTRFLAGTTTLTDYFAGATDATPRPAN